jgi:benzoyl-CoA reductase/2-hydroxyglutaryl-CoA dehydratase subunit BcrC/BadD/HgdB
LGCLAANLETRTGQTLELAALEQSMLLYNEQRSLLARLKRYWRAGSIETAPYRRLRQMALTRDPSEANENLRQALTGIQEDGEGSIPMSACRVLLLSELAAPAPLVRLVEACGARVVAEDSDLDERDITEPVTVDAKTIKKMLGALAQAYLDKPPGPRMRDLTRRMAYLSRLVAEQRVGAALCAYGKFCDLFLAEFPDLRAQLERLGVPVLLLEMEEQDVSGQHRTRVEAFLEMLNQGESD